MNSKNKAYDTLYYFLMSYKEMNTHYGDALSQLKRLSEHPADKSKLLADNLENFIIAQKKNLDFLVEINDTQNKIKISYALNESERKRANFSKISIDFYKNSEQLKNNMKLLKDKFPSTYKFFDNI